MTKDVRASMHEKTVGGHHSTKRHEKKTKFTVRHGLHMVHRASILFGAVAYLAICFDAFRSTLDILGDRDHPSVIDPPDAMMLMGGYLGTAAISKSPLVMAALQGDTSPRNGTLYLEATGPSPKICVGIKPYQIGIYSDPFLRSLYDAVVRGTQYNLTFLASEETELITPVVDCLSSAILMAYLPAGKFNYLVRKKHDPNEVAIVTVQLANQEYRISDQKERGSASVGTMTYISDMQASSVQHHFIASISYPYAEFDFRVYNFLNITSDGMWCLEKIPNEARGDIPNVLTTAYRSGFFLGAETEQFNIDNQVNVNSQIPLHVITQWQRISKTVMRDSWAWVHGIHLLFGIDLLLSLVVLLVVTFRNLQAGKLWIGDAFVSVSTKILFRGALVRFSWYMNSFWSVFEFCLRDAYAMYHFSMSIYPSVMRADSLCLYLSLCGLMGIIFRERVDPMLAMLCFAFGFELRGSLMHTLPKTSEAVGNFGLRTFLENEAPRLENQESISPMSYWTSHELHDRSPLFILQSLAPLLVTLVVILAYIIACKIHRYFFPEKLHIVRRSNTTNTSGTSGREDALLQKRVLTLFEIATGAELEARFGLMSSYENYLFIKGMKFASADGICSSGFVIANNKYALKADDYWSIVLMKLLGGQYKNVFVYAIEGSTVQQTAKLVYPHTFTWSDLVRLNITVLS
ncbi:Transmembrane protein [Globisporangium polare]